MSATEVSFTTYFGDYLHGLFVTWTSTPSTNTGTTDLVIKMQMNLRSKLHVYGFTDSAGGGISAGISSNYSVDAELDWYDEPTKKFDIFVPFDDNPTSYDPTTEQYQMYVVWQNPDSEANVTYDGVAALMTCNVAHATDMTTVADMDALLAGHPTIEMKFEDQTVAEKKFDMSPGSAYGTGSSNQDDVDNITLGANYDLTTDLCTEKWILSPTAVACVEVVGVV